MKVGDKYTVFQYDIHETRDVEIIFIYEQDSDKDSDIIVYKYFGKHIQSWQYKLHRRFEFKHLMEEALKYPQLK